MTKPPKDGSPSQHPRKRDEEKAWIPPRFQHPAAILVIFISLLLFFFPVIFEGKTYLGADTIASHSFDTLLKDAKEQGIFPLWNPYIFCGMPSYGSLTVSGERTFDISAYLYGKLTQAYGFLMLASPIGGVLFYYLLFATGMYVLAYSKVSSKTAALLAALGATYSMYIILWVMVGHNTKIAVMALFPWIMLAVERLRMRFDLTLSLVLVLMLHFSYLPSHVQMIFYVYLALGMYYLYFGIRAVAGKEEWKGVVRSATIFAVASILALAMDADKYLSVFEYNPYSMRGSAPLMQSMQKGETKTQAGGLDYEYATNWSLPPGEMLGFVIPSWAGFGEHSYRGPLTQNQNTRINTYFGPQPQPVDASQYMGVVIVALAFVGAWKMRKEPFVQYLCIVIGISLLISFGREFSFFYDLMFKYFPGFNKFRIPLMILALVQSFVPLLAAFGFNALVHLRDQRTPAQVQKSKKAFLAAFVAVAALCVLLHVSYESLLTRQDIQNMIQSVYGVGWPRDRVVNDVFQRVPPGIIQELTSSVTRMVAQDLYIGLAFLVVAFCAAYLYSRERMKFTTFASVVVIAGVVDLWRVDFMPNDPQDRARQQDIFAPPDYVQYLRSDTSQYRVLKLDGGQPQYDNTLAYWRIQNVYGYQGAKLRAYQDAVDLVGLNNPLLWQLMNVKYVVSSEPDSSAMLQLLFTGSKYRVYAFRAAVPRAFFVNRYAAADARTMLEHVRSLSFNPTDVAYVTEDPGIAVDPPNPDAKVSYVHSGIQDVVLTVTATGNNLLFLSETYYPEGWKAYVDGNETRIYRLNYLFRGVVVPTGTHRIEMRFEPRGFYLGKEMSLAANVLVLTGLAVSIFLTRGRNRHAEASV